MQMRVCYKCKNEKPCYTNGVCRQCMRAYNQDRKEKRESIKKVLRHVEPLGEDRPRGRPKKEPAPKPVSMRERTKHLRQYPDKTGMAEREILPVSKTRGKIKPIKKADLSALDGRETVEQFLARGGSIKAVPIGFTAARDE